MPHFTYILECADGTYYTGYTNHLERRIDTHNRGKWAKYTRGRLPVILRYSESHEDETSAKKREYEIKQLCRAQKEWLFDKKTEIC